MRKSGSSLSYPSFAGLLAATFASAVMLTALPTLASDGSNGDGKNRASEAGENVLTVEDCETREICALDEGIAAISEVEVREADEAQVAGDNTALGDQEKAQAEASRAKACRTARWHEGQGVPYDRFLSDDNQMLKQRVNPHVVVQTSSGGSRIKSTSQRRVDEACAELAPQAKD